MKNFNLLNKKISLLKKKNKKIDCAMEYLILFMQDI